MGRNKEWGENRSGIEWTTKRTEWEKGLRKTCYSNEIKKLFRDGNIK